MSDGRIDRSDVTTDRGHISLIDSSMLVDAMCQMTSTARWEAVLDDKGRCEKLHYSDEFRRLLGYDTIEEFPDTDDALFQVILKGDRVKAQQFISAVEKSRDKDEIFKTEFRVVTKSGEVRWVRVSCKTFYDDNNRPYHIIGTIMDINSDKIVERQTHLVNLLSRDFSSVWYISAKSHKMTLVRQNDSGTTTGNAIGRGLKYDSYEQMFQDYIEHFVDEGDKERVRKEVSFANLLSKVKDDELYPINYLRNNVDGTKSYFQIIFARFKSSSGRLYFTCGFRDVDSIMRSKLEEVEESNKAKSNFLFNMSHDIRTPMNAIIGFTKLAIKRREDDKLLSKYLDNIKTSSENLLEILNGVLEMAKIENDQIEIKKTLVDVGEFFESVVDMFRGDVDKKNQTLIYDNAIKHNLLYIDKAHIEEVIINLISNAVKYTPDGGEIKFKITEEMGATPEDCYVNIFISDNGVGMSKEFLEHVYDLFSRERTSDTVNVSGTGLGLAIAKRLVDLMDGSINIASTKGKGTDISVTLPLKIGIPKPDIESENNIDISTLKGKKILLAEDNDLNAEIAMELLSDEGFEVVRAADGIECVKMYEDSVIGDIDVIFMDIQMPGMDGYQAAKAIRDLDDKDKAKIPIIAVTANAFSEDKHNAYLAGMNAHIAKPFDLNNVYKTMYNVLEHSEYYIDNNEITSFKDKYVKLGRIVGHFICIEDICGRIVYADSKAANVLGYDNKDELINTTKGGYITLIYPKDADRIITDVSQRLDRGENTVSTGKYSIIARDNSLRQVDTIISKIYNGAQFEYYIYIVDVTEPGDVSLDSLEQ